MDRLDLQKIFDSSLNDIVGLLQIPSVYDESTINEKMPYGLNVYKAFMYMKDMAEKDGFNVKECDGHVLIISFGKGPRMDIACHLDVVAAEKEDFNIRIEDDKLIGRGTSDMKVPTYLVYLSLKMLKDKYPDLKKEIRLVLGGDEERTMNDMKYYVEKQGLPEFAFTPDGYFPIGIGEKGAIMWTLRGDYDGVIKELDGGSQCNIISPYATALLKDISKKEEADEYIRSNKIDGKTSVENDLLKIETNGIGAHASRPKLGHNATIDLLKIIADVYNDKLSKNLYEIFSDSYGRGFNSYISEDQYKCLSVNLGRLTIKDNTVHSQVDCRYPFGKKAEELTDLIKERCIIDVSLDYNDDPTMCDEDDPYVQTMLKTYRDITGDYSEPVVSGGVSYSKVFGHCVGFGPMHEGKPEMAHQKGEYVLLKDCVEWFEIYYKTIENLILMEVKQ